MVRKLDPVVTNLRARRSGDGEVFFPALALQRLKLAEQRKLDYKWQGRVYPSGLSFSMCPHKYIREDVHVWNPPDSDGIDRIEIGKAYHRLVTELVKNGNYSCSNELIGHIESIIGSDDTLENVLKGIYKWEAKHHPDLLYGKPTVPPELIADDRKNWEEDFAKKFPAIPAVWPAMHLSGEIDLVLNLQGKPVVIDLKFPQESDPAKWSDKRKMFPGEQYETQVCVYAEICNQLHYFDQDIETVGILALNPLIKNSRGLSTIEWYVPYDDIRRNKTQELIKHLVKEVDDFNNKVDSICMYPYCAKHAKNA